MRISTAYIFQNGLNGILDREAELSKIQQQVASGKNILRAADDPAGAAMSLDLQQSIDSLDQFNRNGDRLQSRLGLEDNALSSTVNLVTRVRELAIEGANATQSDASRSNIAAELDQISGQLLDLANSRDESGRYLFGGYQGGSAPFAMTAGSVAYRGDSGVRELDIGPSRHIADSNPGDAVFMAARSGNGTFDVGIGSNSGSVLVKDASVVDPAAWVADQYTISFDGAGHWAASGSGGPVATGSYSSGTAIQFAGASITVEGQPAAGDSLTVAPSSASSLFDVVATLKQQFETPTPTSADKAALTNTVFATLQNLSQISDHLSSVQATVGARLNAVDQQASANDAAGVQLKTSLSGLQDLDYAKAVSDMQLKLTGLQAAQQAFTKVQGLSLFDYLR